MTSPLVKMLIGTIFAMWIALILLITVFHSPALVLTSQNEDQLATTKIPNDVLEALDQAKSTGNPVLGIRTDGLTYHIPVLLYHYVEEVKDPRDTNRISLSITPETLDRQIATLLHAGYTFINASDLANILDGIDQAPAKPIVITFDDGHRDFYTDAYPILKKYKVKAVAYVVTGYINGSDFLTDSELQELAHGGLVEIGSHTVDHLALQGLPKSKVRDELESSKIQLEQKLGTLITTLAYPYGSFDLTAIQTAKQAGYRTAFSVIPGAEVSNSVRLFVSRIRPGSLVGQSLLDLVQKTAPTN